MENNLKIILYEKKKKKTVIKFVCNAVQFTRGTSIDVG